MRNKILLIICFFSLLIFASACGKENSANSFTSSVSQNSENTGNTEYTENGIVKITDEKSFDYENYDWETLIKETAFDKNTKIGSEALKVLEIEITEITGENISVKIKAPYIKDELISWFNESYSSTDSLENEIVKLLKNEKKEYTFTLDYFASENKEPHIDFTSEFSDAVTCGILEFTAIMEAEFIEELEGGIYD